MPVIIFVLNFLCCFDLAAFGLFYSYCLSLGFLFVFHASAKIALTDIVRVNMLLYDDMISCICRYLRSSDHLEEISGLKFLEAVIAANSWLVLRAVLGESVQYAMSHEEAYFTLADHWSQKIISYVIVAFGKIWLFILKKSWTFFMAWLRYKMRIFLVFNNLPYLH